MDKESLTQLWIEELTTGRVSISSDFGAWIEDVLGKAIYMGENDHSPRYWLIPQNWIDAGIAPRDTLKWLNDGHQFPSMPILTLQTRFKDIDPLFREITRYEADIYGLYNHAVTIAWAYCKGEITISNVEQLIGNWPINFSKILAEIESEGILVSEDFEITVTEMDALKVLNDNSLSPLPRTIRQLFLEGKLSESDVRKMINHFKVAASKKPRHTTMEDS